MINFIDTIKQIPKEKIKQDTELEELYTYFKSIFENTNSKPTHSGDGSLE